jgi:hypothetical protein
MASGRWETTSPTVLLSRSSIAEPASGGGTGATEDYVTLPSNVGMNELLRTSRIDVAAMLRDLCAEMNPSASAKGLTLDATLPDHEVSVLGEATELRSLFVILLDNAIKYTEAGSIQLSLGSNGPQVSVKIDHRHCNRYRESGLASCLRPILARRQSAVTRGRRSRARPVTGRADRSAARRRHNSRKRNRS